MVNNRKKSSSTVFNGNVSKPSAKKPPKHKFDDDDWFNKKEDTFESLTKKGKSNEDPWLSDIGTATNSFHNKPAEFKSNDLFENSPINNVNKNVHRSDNKNEVRKKVESERSNSEDFSDDSKSIGVTKNTKAVAEYILI